MTEPQQRWVAILGRPDVPTDGVEDYCTFLGDALRRHGIELKQARVAWAEKGWIGALKQLSQESAGWRGRWVLLQYTSLAWSRRGFSVGVLPVIWILKRYGLRVVIVFHDVHPFSGKRLRDRIRTQVQALVMRRLVRSSSQSISAIPAKQMGWILPESLREKFVTIPIGSNVPEGWPQSSDSAAGKRTVTVFTVTEGAKYEAACLGRIAREIARSVGSFRLVVMGRGALEAGCLLRDAVAGAPVELVIHGILSPEEISDILNHSDLQLYIRSGISTRRGCVVAGICSGLPVAGWSDKDTTFPITEAGIRTAAMGDEGKLIQEIVVILTDDQLRAQLKQRSRFAAERFFKWNAIASHFCRALRQGPSQGGLSVEHERSKV